MAHFSDKSMRFIERPPQHDAFINILEGAVRSSKNYTMIPKILCHLNWYPVKGERIIFGVSKETIYNNVLNDIFNFSGRDTYHYNRQSGELWLRGTRWRVVGAKDEGSEKYIRGATVGLAYGDELVLLPKSFFEMMTSRMSPEGSRLYGTTNPDNPFHYINTDYLEDKDKRTAGLVWSDKFMIDDNLSLSEETKQRYRKMYKDVFKKRMIDGLWVVAEGAIYKDSYSDELLYDDSTRPVGLGNSGGFVAKYIALDYGTHNPMVFLLIIDDGKVYWVDREYYWDSSVTGFQKTDGKYCEDLIDFRDKYGAQAQCIIDPSAASFKAEMNLKGIWHCDADNEVECGIQNVSSLLAQKKIRIHKRCEKLIAELQSYSWNPLKQKVGLDEPLKQHDHAPDALRYFVQTKVPAYRITFPLAA